MHHRPVHSILNCYRRLEPRSGFRDKLQSCYGLAPVNVAQLLSREELWDWKPSALLMQTLTMVDDSQKVDKEFMKTLIMQRLPNNVQTIAALAVEDLSLDKFFQQADKIVEVNLRAFGIIASVRKLVNETINAFQAQTGRPHTTAPVSPSELVLLTETLSNSCK